MDIEITNEDINEALKKDPNMSLKVQIITLKRVLDETNAELGRVIEENLVLKGIEEVMQEGKTNAKSR